MAELVYPGKTSFENILGEINSVSLKKIRVSGHSSEGDWTNLIFLGDNLPILKSLLDWRQRGEFVNRDGSPGIRLIYIDPPFGTGDTYERNAVQAYSGKTTGDRYLEWLHRRIILLRELLSEDGSFYMRTDYHFGHYMKVICDEVFGADKFRNEIIINRTKKVFEGISRFNTATDSVLFYTKSDRYFFNGADKPRAHRKWIPMHSPGIRWSRVDPDYESFYDRDDLDLRKNGVFSRGRVFEGKVLIPPEGRHWTFSQKRLERYGKEGRIRTNPRNGIPEYLMSEKEIVDSDWTDIPGYSFKWNYPTENSEQLLERIIGASSEPGDILLDAFAGSGTTGAVGEKMGRRWIMADSSRTSGFTMLRRMLSISSPFAVYEAVYGEEILSGLSFEKYARVALELFSVEVSARTGIDGMRGNDPVIVYNWKTEGPLQKRRIQELHGRLIEYSDLGDRFFVIAPSPVVAFQEGSLQLENREYHILKVPDSILLELSGKDGRTDIKYLVNEVAMDLVSPPSVKYRRYAENGEIVVKILDFRSRVHSKRHMGKDARALEALGMIAVDEDFNGEYFRFSRVWQPQELAEMEYEIRFPVADSKKEVMIVIWDKYGNYSSSQAGQRKSR